MDVYVRNGRDQHRTRAAVAIAALCIALAAAVVLFGREVILSLKEYDLMRGIFASPWVGFKNYQGLLQNANGGRIIANTLVYNLLFACICFFISAIGGLIVHALPKRSILRDALAALAVLPVFIPGEVYAAWFMNFFGSLPFTNAGSARFLLPFVAALKYVGIPILVAHIVGILKKVRDTLLPVKCAGLFSLAMLSLAGAGHFSLINQLANPLIYQSADILDTYSFRTGFMQMNVGMNAAAGVLQVLICLVSMAVLFIPMKILFAATFDGEKEYRGYSVTKSLLGAVIAFVVFVLLYLLPYVANGTLSGFSGFRALEGGNAGQGGMLSAGVAFIASPGDTVRWVMISLAAALLCTCIAFAASGFADGGRGARTGGAVLLAGITVLTVQPFTMSGYLLIRSIGMVNTYMAVITVSIFSAAAVWAFAAMRGDEYMRDARGLLFGAVGILLIQLALIYSNGTSSLLYLNKPDMSPLLLYRVLATGIQTVKDHAERAALAGTIGLSGLMLSLPAVLAFLLAKVLLPAEALLAAISGGRKQ